MIDAKPWEVLWPEPAPLHPDLVEGTLEKILDAAGRVFARSGIGDVRMPRIAEEAGVSKPTLYRYVSGRQSLVELYFVREGRRLLDDVLSRHWTRTLGPERLATILVDLHFATRRHPVVDKMLRDEWNLISLFVSRSLADESAAAVLDVLSFLFNEAGIDEPRFSAEVNMRVLSTLLVAPPYTVPDSAAGVRRFLYLPVKGGPSRGRR